MLFSSKKRSASTGRSPVGTQQTNKVSEDPYFVVDKSRILEILTSIQSISSEIDISEKSHESISSYIIKYKKIVQKFNVITVDPKEVFEDFWGAWNDFVDVVDAAIPVEYFDNIVSFVKQQLPRSQKYFKKTENVLQRTKPKCQSKFDTVINGMQKIIDEIDEIKNGKELQNVLLECKNSIKEKISPYFKNDQVSQQYQYYSAAFAFFDNAFKFVKKYNEDEKWKNDYLKSIAKYGKELSVLVPKSLKKMKASSFEVSKQKKKNSLENQVKMQVKPIKTQTKRKNTSYKGGISVSRAPKKVVIPVKMKQVPPPESSSESGEDSNSQKTKKRREHEEEDEPNSVYSSDSYDDSLPRSLIKCDSNDEKPNDTVQKPPPVSSDDESDDQEMHVIQPKKMKPPPDAQIPKLVAKKKAGKKIFEIK